MLKVENLHINYGFIEAVKGIDFTVNDGEIVALIGANGAGKTTTMHALSGLIKAKSGSIVLDGKDITKVPANKIVSLGLKERQKQLAGTLSGGEQQMLAMGRALMSNPKVLLLDEPSMGLSPLLVKEIFAIIKEINDNGTTVFVVEQNAKMALEIAHRAYVMETGKLVLSGTGKELLASDAVSKAYLGG